MFILSEALSGEWFSLARKVSSSDKGTVEAYFRWSWSIDSIKRVV
jgi:hypothetical protein